MKRLLTIAIMLLAATAARAQISPFDVIVKHNPDNSVSLVAAKTDIFSYSVVLTFYNLQNAWLMNPVRAYVKNSGEFLRITPLTMDQPINFSLSYTTIIGRVSPEKPDSNYVCRLPFSSNRNVTASAIRSYDEVYSGSGNHRNWHAWGFDLEKGDTIYPVRKGLVINVTDEQAIDTTKWEISYNSRHNSIIVEHEDGTRSQYSVLENNSVMVREGQRVYPDTPLALAGDYGKGKYGVILMDYYLIWNPGKKERYKTDYTSTVFINPVFSTTAGRLKLDSGERYTPYVTKELVMAEMTKREIKKRESDQQKR